MKRPAQLTENQVKAALIAANGNVTYAAQQLGVHREALTRRIRRNEDLQAVLAEARESMIDIAESALRREVEAGSKWAVTFTLRTVGRNRGYVERQESTIESHSEVVIDFSRVSTDELRALLGDQSDEPDPTDEG